MSLAATPFHTRKPMQFILIALLVLLAIGSIIYFVIQKKESINQTPITSWLTDFAFRDLRLPVINLWACRIIYAICCIVAALILPIWIVLAIVSLAEVPAALLIVVPFAVICVAIFVFAARLACEWYIIVFDWIVETTKAARIYIEDSKKEQAGTKTEQ